MTSRLFKAVAVTVASQNFVASELKDPICHSDECQIAFFSSEATVCSVVFGMPDAFA